MKIVDSHIHLWDLSTGLYPDLEQPSTGFLGDNAAIARSYLLEEFLDEARAPYEIAGAVHIEASPTDGEREARAIQAVADASSVPLGLVAHADLSADNVAQTLERLAAVPVTRGIRQVLSRHPSPIYNHAERDFLHDAAWLKGFARLAEHALPFDLQLYPHQAEAAAAVIRQHPQIPVVLNHAGMWVDRDLAGWRRWREGLRMLAALPNTHVKISGLGMFDHQWTTMSLTPLVLETLDAFGSERSLFASNFPVDKLYSHYNTLWHAFDRITASLSDSERDALFRANAVRLYCLEDN